MDEEKKQSRFQKLFDKSAPGIAKKTISNVFKNYRWLFRADLIVTAILAIYLSGIIKAKAMHLEGTISSVNPGTILICGIWYNLLLTIVFFCLLNYGAYRICALFYKEKEVDEERNYDSSTKGYLGTSRKMSLEDKEKAFNSGDYLTLLDNIIGAELDDIMKMYTVKTAYGINGNLLVIGAPGSGKSRCIALPTIFQTIRRGESMVIMDPKGELYGKTAVMARAHGYTVKVLNLKPKEMMHSDSCNFMSVVGQDDLMAMSFASTIVQNTSNGKDEGDFWSKSELNLLTAVILFVANNNIGIEKTLAGVHKLVTTNTVESLDTLFASLPDTHPAKGPYNLFTNGDKTVKGNTLAGLGFRLQVFNNPLVRKVTGTDDIDFTLPGREKCLYFVGCSDQDSSMSFIVALFFTLLYQELVDLADSMPERCLPIKVTMLLDEFANSGVIPAFEKRLSTVRSRGIDTIIILQDLGQLQKMYPENTWETIINDCSQMILLRTNSQLTAEYFSQRSGDQTIEDKSKRYEESAGDILKVHGTYMVSESHNRRVVFTPGEVYTLNPGHMLYVLSSYNVAELQKIDYANHPMNKEIHEVVASEHTPKWIYDVDQSEYTRYGITDKEVYASEDIEVELCTEDDFAHPYKKPESKEKIEEDEEEFEEYEADEEDKVDMSDLDMRR